MENNVYDLCVVGAGMFGSAAARHASAIAGIKVCLIGPDEPTPEEKQGREIFSAHYDEGRITRTLDDDIPSQVLAKHSISRYRELEELSGIHFYHPVGFIWVSRKDSPNIKKTIEMSKLSNLPIVDLSYHDIFRRRYPFIKLKEDDSILLDDFGAGHISPRRMVAAQKKVARLQGCDIIHKVVNEVTPLIDEVHEIITEDGEVVKARRVLICTGAFTNLKKFPMPKLKITINKETVAFLKLPLKEVHRLSAMPTIVYARPEDKIGAYILPPIEYPNGNYYLKIGHLDFNHGEDQLKTLEEVKKWYLSKGDSTKIENLSKLLIDMLPGLTYEDITGMTCVTCDNPSGQPYIDRISPTVTVAAVGNGRGAKFSDEVGRIAATLSVTGRWDSELPKSVFKIILDNDAEQ